MKTLIDTQVLSTHFKSGEGLSSLGNSISSITANEFLWVYRTGARKPDYYIVHPARYSRVDPMAHLRYLTDHFKNKRWAMNGACRTDQLTIDFKNQFPAYNEFGLEAIATIINERKLNIFNLSIAHLEKKKRRYLKKRIQFIVKSQYVCIAINKSIMSIAMNLFSSFLERYNCKADMRNSINDIMILATAVERQMLLISKDSLLNRFAAQKCNATIKEVRDVLEIDFESADSHREIYKAESKGYINKGWSYSIRNGKLN